jgi:hypothetical protein
MLESLYHLRNLEAALALEKSLHASAHSGSRQIGRHRRAVEEAIAKTQVAHEQEVLFAILGTCASWLSGLKFETAVLLLLHLLFSSS